MLLLVVIRPIARRSGPIRGVGARTSLRARTWERFPDSSAAAAILADYTLTVAVSITAGTVAIASAAPRLHDSRVPIAVALVALVTLANLRGVKEAGTLFAIPTYGFVAIVVATLVVGFGECLGDCPVAETAQLPLRKRPR